MKIYVLILGLLVLATAPVAATAHGDGLERPGCAPGCQVLPALDTTPDQPCEPICELPPSSPLDEPPHPPACDGEDC